MIRHLPKSLSTRLNKVREASRTQWVTVTVSFLSAVTLWFLVTLNSRNYQAYITYPIKVGNVPADILLDENQIPHEVVVTSKGSGIKLLSEYLNLTRDTINIDFRKHKANGTFNYIGNLPTIQEAMPLGVSAIKIEPEIIPLEFQTRISKIVPVVNAIKPILPETYRLATPPTFEPDSVKILGPEKLLIGINSWKTQALEIPIGPGGGIKTILLDTLALFKVIPSKILATFSPIPFTEAEFRIPLEVIHLPEGVRLDFNPPEVLIKLSIPFEVYNDLDPTDLNLQIDYDRINPQSTFAIPHLAKVPEQAILLEMIPEKVEFLIIKEK